MVWRSHINLPGELAGKIPPLISQVLIALALVLAATVLRMIIEQFVPIVLPFTFTFPAIAAAALVAGGRSAVMTLLGSDFVNWVLIPPPPILQDPVTTATNLIVILVAQLVIIWSLTAYREATAVIRASDEDKIRHLSLALEEMDHRTKNNFQIAIGLLSVQARALTDPAARAAVEGTAARLQAVASIYKNLSLSSAGLRDVRLHDHLREICDRIRVGLLPPSVQLHLHADELVVPHGVAMRVGLIVNELVTNAAKHAFPEGSGTIFVRYRRTGDRLNLEISDDGRGIDSNHVAPTGLGQKLVQALVRQLDGAIEMRTDGGTTYAISFPLAAASAVDEPRTQASSISNHGGSPRTSSAE